MKAKLTVNNFRRTMGSMQLDLQITDPLKCACSDLTDIDAVYSTIANLRTLTHRQVDNAIDCATADFLKSKLKNIE